MRLEIGALLWVFEGWVRKKRIGRRRRCVLCFIPYLDDAGGGGEYGVRAVMVYRAMRISQSGIPRRSRI